MKAESFIKSVNAVTKKWTKQRKAEERRASARANRYHMWRAPRVTLIDAAEQVMEEAYNKASNNGKYPALARQIMYAARPAILSLVDDVAKLDSNYFTQTLLPGYMKKHPEKTAGWNVAYDPRGHFHEPHTEKTVALGTLEVRKYLHGVRNHVVGDVDKFEFRNSRYPTRGPAHRFSAITFIEKEGFMPLFQQVQLAERYDIGIMSTKGMSVTAAREMVDVLCCREGGVPLFVLRDFDQAGFSIVHSLRTSNHRNRFRNRVQVIDLGLRLADAEANNLESEEVHYGSWPGRNLRKNGATEEEIKFLCGGGRHGHRVELNAFTSEKLVEWIESKLQEHGVKKMVPSADTLVTAYRRALEIEYVNHRLPAITAAAGKNAKAAEIPKTLERMIRKRLKDDPKLPWDKAVAEVAARNCKKPASQRDQ